MCSLQIEDLNRESFLPFGHVIDSNTGRTPATYPAPEGANQGYALRFGDVTHLVSLHQYTNAKIANKATTSLFVALPRDMVFLPDSGVRIPSNVLERHPFTSQTFVPMGLSADDSSTAFIVLVAPGLFLDGRDIEPDMTRLRAFLARGDQAITYLAGIWHAPLIVIGKRPVHFVAIQYTSGKKQYDCEEIKVKETIIYGLEKVLRTRATGSKM